MPHIRSIAFNRIIPSLFLFLSAITFPISVLSVPAPGPIIITPEEALGDSGELSNLEETPTGLFERSIHGNTRAVEERSFQIHPGYDQTKCLDVRESGYQDGTYVDIFDCNGTPAQNWVIQPGTTQVRVAGRNFCLDASPDPVNGTKMKIWTCYPGFAAQTWYYTDDKRIALKDQGMCLDLTDGNTENFSITQVWKCTNGNGNQIWSIENTH